MQHKYLGTFVPSFGERLRSERERLGDSQTAFAERCGVTPRSQRNYESGDRLPDAAYLSAAMSAGIDLVYVIAGDKVNRALTPDLTRDEQEMLALYRSAPLAGKAAAVGALQGVVTKVKASQVFHGEVGQSFKAKKLVQKRINFSMGEKSKK